MKSQVIHKLHISWCALDKIAPELGYLMAHLVPYAEGEQVDGESDPYVCIQYPNTRYPELTKALFWSIVCKTLPVSKSYWTALHVEALITTDDGKKDIVQITDSHIPDYGETPVRHFIRDDILAEDMSSRIKQIRKLTEINDD